MPLLSIVAAFFAMSGPLSAEARPEVGVAGTVPGDVDQAVRELGKIGVPARACDVALACVEDVPCALGALARCSLDALVFVDAHDDPDGRWVRTVLVDDSGAVAFALDEPRGVALLSPALRESARSVTPRAHARAAPVPRRPSDGPDVRDARDVRDVRADGPDALDTPDTLTWLGVGGVGVGALVAGTAATAAWYYESVLSAPTSGGDEKVTARSAARVAWLVTGAGALVLATGVVVLLSSLDAGPSGAASADAVGAGDGNQARPEAR